jgi:ribosomal-protein-alanine N-acetyltransferase
MVEIEIREMQVNDIPEILKIERVSFSTPWSETAFFHEVHKSYALSKVAISKKIIIGYICVNRIFDECHILNIAAHPDFRRRGIGTVLLEEALNELKGKGCRFFYLEVRASNVGAKKFYERFGFRVVGLRRKYYVSPVEDAALMALTV